MKRSATALICAAILLVAAGIAVVIFMTEPSAERSAASRATAMLVDVTEARRGSFTPRIEAMGTAQPALEVALSPRVGGEVVERAEDFEPGGFVDQGEVLLRIDPSDYRNALEQRRSELRQAQADLALEMGRQNVAEQDYELLERSLPEEQRALVLREPQLNSALASVESAEAAVEQAELDLQRTEVRAPFDAHVLSREVNLGSQIAPGEELGRLVGSDVYWVELAVPLTKLPWIAFPDRENGQGGAAVELRNRAAWPPGAHRTGRVLRLIGALEEDTRMARVLVEVTDPLAQESENAGQPSLMIGAFLEATIEGKTLEDVARVSRDHVRDENTVWLMEDGKLRIREVEIVLRDQEYAYARSGLEEGDRIVTTNLSAPTEGAELRVAEDEPEDDPTEEETEGGVGPEESPEEGGD